MQTLLLVVLFEVCSVALVMCGLVGTGNLLGSRQ